MTQPIEAHLLSKVERIRLRIMGRVYIGDRIRDDWKKALPHFLARCKKHGLYLDYGHGWKLEIECPACLFNRVGRGQGRMSR